MTTTNRPTSPRPVRALDRTARRAGAVVAVFGLAALVTTSVADANGSGRGGRIPTLDVFELTPPEGLPIAFPGTYAPRAVQVSATFGRVTPPSPERPVLRGFDAVNDCAGVDLRSDLSEAAAAKIAARPRLDRLELFWQAHGLETKAVALGAEVPPLFLEKLPPRFAEAELDVPRKKRAFILAMLPHILAVNDEIRADRARLLAIRANLEDPTGPGQADLEWMFGMFEDYGVEEGDFDRLLARVDVIPVALALAQAAKESGWGASRFAQAGNALYGQWTWDEADKGMVPRNRPEGKTYRVRAFDSVLDATRAYAININTHPAYEQLRQMRLEIRGRGDAPTGLEFTEALDKYATIGKRYGRALRNIINRNGLTELNTAALGLDVAPPPRFDPPAIAEKFAEAG